MLLFERHEGHPAFGNLAAAIPKDYLLRLGLGWINSTRLASNRRESNSIN